MTKGPVDHKKRIGKNYKGHPVSEETRHRASEAMKAFNRKTGKVTLQGNRLTGMKRKPKG